MWGYLYSFLLCQTLIEAFMLLGPFGGRTLLCLLSVFEYLLMEVSYVFFPIFNGGRCVQ